MYWTKVSKLVIAIFLFSFVGKGLVEGREKAAKLENVIITSASGTDMGRIDWDIGMEKGFFQREGISLEIVVAKGQIRMAGLKSGNFDYSIEGTDSLWAIATGLPSKVIFFTSPKRPNFLLTKPDIKEPRDLKGKVIGVGTFGSTEHMGVDDIGKQVGLAPGDITVIGLGPGMIKLQSLVAGSVDGVVCGSPINFLLEDRGFRKLLNIYDYFPTFSLMLTTRDDTIKKNREQVKRMVRATLRSHLFVLGNKEEIVGFLVNKAASERSIALRTYDAYMVNYTANGLVTEAAIQYQVEVGRRVGRPIPKTVTIPQMADLSILKEVHKELGL